MLYLSVSVKNNKTYYATVYFCSLTLFSVLVGSQPSTSSQSFYLQANEEDGKNGKQFQYDDI